MYNSKPLIRKWNYRKKTDEHTSSTENEFDIIIENGIISLIHKLQDNENRGHLLQ